FGSRGTEIASPRNSAAVLEKTRGRPSNYRFGPVTGAAFGPGPTAGKRELVRVQAAIRSGRSISLPGGLTHLGGSDAVLPARHAGPSFAPRAGALRLCCRAAAGGAGGGRG